MNDRTVGYAVKVLRERKGLTQDGLGLASGVSQGSVLSLEAGRLGRMTVRTIRKILAEVDADGSMSIWWREGSSTCFWTSVTPRFSAWSQRS